MDYLLIGSLIFASLAPSPSVAQCPSQRSGNLPALGLSKVQIAGQFSMAELVKISSQPSSSLFMELQDFLPKGVGDVLK